VDIYALGAILYESLTGRPPFKGATALDTLREVLHDDVVPPRQFQRRVPRDLETICLKALAKTPARRYASALEMAEDLERFLKGEPIKARPMGRAERLWHWCRHNPVAASLLVAVTLGSAFGLWHLSRLSKQLVESTALESAAQEASMLEEVNNVYSADVAERVKPLGVLITNDYLDHPGAIPVPATLTIVLGRHMSTKDQEGMQVRLYSDYPFYSRKDGGPQDEFEKEALAALRRNSAEPYYRFVDFQGRPAVRYAQARVMQQACVNCHNTHPESPKKDWKVGDVRGVLEIIRPLEADAARTRAGLWSSFLWMGVLSAGLLALCGLILFLGRRRRARSQSARAPSP